MKKYTLIIIPVILILFFIYINLISADANKDCKNPALSTMTGNQNLKPEMHCTCDPYIPVAIDDEQTDDEIDAGSGVSIFIKDGCPPFKWEVSGKGYTWNANGATNCETNDRFSQLNCNPGT